MAESFTIPLLNSIYGLNKSYTKKLFVGLEFDALSEEKFYPVVRMLASDFVGITFSIESWNQFKESFDEITKWFNKDFDIKLADTKIYGNGWSIRFMTSSGNRVIEIQEEIKATGSIKKFRRSFAIAEVSFNNIKNYLSKCVDLKLKYLQSASAEVSGIVKKIFECVFNKIMFDDEHNAQKTIIENSDINYLISNSEKIKQIVHEIDSNILTKLDIEMITYQIFCTHSNQIIEILNNKINL